MAKASAAAGWLQSLKAVKPAPGEAVEYGISSFVYRYTTVVIDIGCAPSASNQLLLRSAH